MAEASVWALVIACTGCALLVGLAALVAGVSGLRSAGFALAILVPVGILAVVASSVALRRGPVWQQAVLLGGMIPQIALVLGAAALLSQYRPDEADTLFWLLLAGGYVILLAAKTAWLLPRVASPPNQSSVHGRMNDDPTRPSSETIAEPRREEPTMAEVTRG